VSRSDLFVFLHVHKTAGTTFGANLMENFRDEECLPLYARRIGLELTDGMTSQGWDAEKIEAYVAALARPEVRLVHGHMVYWGVHEPFGPSRRPYYLTFLRDPVERVISLYYYHLRGAGVWHREIADNGWSIEEWLERSRMLWRRDGQVRQLLWHAHGEVLRDDALTAAHLEEAQRLLGRFDFVGTTETFEQAALTLYGRLGLRRFHDERVVNATPHKEDVPEDVRRLIAEWNRLDVELYRFACRHRLRMPGLHRPRSWLHRNAARARRKLAIRLSGAA
jgi:hypothetical protein